MMHSVLNINHSNHHSPCRNSKGWENILRLLLIPRNSIQQQAYRCHDGIDQIYYQVPSGTRINDSITLVQHTTESCVCAVPSSQLSIAIPKFQFVILNILLFLGVTFLIVCNVVDILHLINFNIGVKKFGIFSYTQDR